MAQRFVIPDTAFRTTRRTTKRTRFRGGADSDKHRDFLHSLPCVVTGSYDRIEAAHISYADPRYGKLGRGIGSKEDDFWRVPMSSEQHGLQHGMDEHEFWEIAGIDPCRIAAALFVCFMNDDRDAAMVVIQHARDA